MKEVPLSDAKARFSAVVRRAERGEPTVITKHGRRTAVVLSYKQWARLNRNVPSFADLLLAMPLLDPSDLPKRRPAHDSRRFSQE